MSIRFKEEVRKYAVDHTFKETAKKFGIHHSTVSGWVKESEKQDKCANFGDFFREKGSKHFHPPMLAALLTEPGNDGSSGISGGNFHTLVSQKIKSRLSKNPHSFFLQSGNRMLCLLKDFAFLMLAVCHQLLESVIIY